MLVDVAFKMKCKYKYTVGFFLLEMRRPLFVQICLSFDCIVELSNKIAAIIYQCSFAKYLAKSCLKNIYFFNKIPKSSLEQCFQLSLFKYIHEIFFPCFQFKKFKKTFFLLSQQ